MANKDHILNILNIVSLKLYKEKKKIQRHITSFKISIKIHKNLTAIGNKSKFIINET